MKTKTLLTRGLIGSALLVSAATANAAFVEYFGEDLNPGFTVPAGGASATARTDFLNTLQGVSNQDFEGFAVGTGTPLNMNFTGSAGTIGATFQGTGVVENNAGGAGSGGNAFGRFNTTTGGSQYWEATQQFSIDFNTGISAFGFYATDIGDFNGQVTLTAANGTVTDIVINNTIGAPNGSLLFYGFTDTDNTYTSITFGNTAAGIDFFGFDDMVVGDLGQIKVPEPSAIALLGLGLVGLGFARRRQA